MPDTIVREFLPAMLSSEIIGIVANSMNADAMDGCIPRRHSSFVYWIYFLIKPALYSLYFSVLEYGVSFHIEMLGVLLSALSAVLSGAVLYYTWRCELVRLLSLSLVCEAVTTSCQMGSFMLVGFTTGNHVDTLHPGSPTPELMLGSLLAVAAYLMARKPERLVLRWLNKEVGRRQPLWMFSFVVAVTLTFLSIHSFWLPPLVLACVMTPTALLVFGPALYLKLRETSLRERALKECAELSGSYDETVRIQLASLERDRVALEGHEAVLEHLRAYGDDSFQDQIEALEEGYRRLKRVSYCQSPGLDAVLLACARRLEQLGIQTSLSVAGDRTNQAGLVSIVYSMLGIARDVAASSRDASDGFVSLRVRPTDAGTLLRMETPASWGPLNARKVLKPYRGHGVLALDEHRQGSMRVVLVLAEENQE